jgi:hypothetical protein
MSVTQQELDAFHRFASERLQRNATETTWDDLVVEWELHRNRADINAAIKCGLEDAACRPPPRGRRCVGRSTATRRAAGRMNFINDYFGLRGGFAVSPTLACFNMNS